MQRLLIKVKKVSRSDAARRNAIKKKINKIEVFFNQKIKGFEHGYDEQVAHFALLDHIKRTEKAIRDLSESKANPEEYKKEEEALKKLQDRLVDLNKKIEKSCQAHPMAKWQASEIESKAEAPTILVAGAGPIGYFAATHLLTSEQREKHQSRVVLIADKHADIPIRGGSVIPPAVYQYFCILGLQKSSMAKLMEFITLSKPRTYSIKDLERLGKAACLARGATIIKGTFDYSEIKSTEKQDLPTAQVTALDGKSKIPVPRVSCVINAMGGEATYPEGIKRTRLLPDRTQLRTQSAQLNILCPKKMAAMISKLQVRFGGSYVVISEFNKKEPQKVQIFPLLTEAESKVLDALVAQQLPRYQGPETSGVQKEELELILKTFFFLDFLNSLWPQPGLKLSTHEEPTPAEAKKAKAFDRFLNFFGATHRETELLLRDQIKSGKPLCRAFELPQPSAPPQEVVFIPGTRALTTWVGGAALPFALTGDFVAAGAVHAKEVLNYLTFDLMPTVRSEKKEDKLEASPFTFDRKSDKGRRVNDTYKEWTDQMDGYVYDFSAPDLSARMQKYFEKTYGLTSDIKDEKRNGSEPSSPGIESKSL